MLGCLSVMKDRKNVDELILWIDVETTGVDPYQDSLLEIGAIFTDMSGKIVSEPFTALVHIDNISHVIRHTDATVQKMHDDSGLWLDLWKEKTYPYSVVETKMLEWLKDTINLFDDPLIYFGGNSISLDRSYILRYLPAVYHHISHRSIDVTSISLFLQSNTFISGYHKSKDHRALLDVYDSIREYQYYLNSVRNAIVFK